MKRLIRILTSTVLLLFAFSFSVRAASLENAVGDLYEALPEEISGLLPEGIESDIESGNHVSAADKLGVSFIIDSIVNAFSSAFSNTVAPVLSLISIVVLSAVLNYVGASVGKDTETATGFASGLCVILTVFRVVTPLWKLMSDTLLGIGLIIKSALIRNDLYIRRVRKYLGICRQCHMADSIAYVVRAALRIGSFTSTICVLWIYGGNLSCSFYGSSGYERDCKYDTQGIYLASYIFSCCFYCGNVVPDSGGKKRGFHDAQEYQVRFRKYDTCDRRSARRSSRQLSCECFSDSGNGGYSYGGFPYTVCSSRDNKNYCLAALVYRSPLQRQRCSDVQRNRM